MITAIFKSDISDHFPIGIFFIIENNKNGVTYINHSIEMLTIVTNSENDWTGKIVAIKYLAIIAS